MSHAVASSFGSHHEQFEPEKIMINQREALGKLFEACWKDEALKARFMSDPKPLLTEYGINVPEGVEVKIVENDENTVHITSHGQGSQARLNSPRPSDIQDLEHTNGVNKDHDSRK
jgi:hypothetical protein